MKVAIILAVALATVASGSPLAKKSIKTYLSFKGSEGRIVGGVEATPYEFPWIVDMRRPSHYCAGSIISPEWVVTAAHCSQASPTVYTLTAGDHNINQIEGNEQTRQVVQIINHPSYDSPMDFENDIALMKVDPPFIFNNYVQPIILPRSGHMPTPVATVTGWGALTEGGSSPSSLMKVDVPYVNDTHCNLLYGGGIADSMVCYGEAGKDSCQGDSGGPIMNRVGMDWLLVGIVSWGFGCARPNYPGVYTEASYYYDWIQSATIPTAEDPSPVTNVTTCGGFVETSSARISFNPGMNLPSGTKCMWTIKTPYDSLRVRLTQSGLITGDGLYVVRYDGNTGSPGQQTPITQVNMDYNMTGGMAFIVLNVHEGGMPSQGIILEFYSSGFGDSSPALSGFQTLTQASGSFSYPIGGGQYRNNENALVVISPAQSMSKTLTFNYMDVEAGTGCPYDKVGVYSWQNNMFLHLQTFCGTQPPAPFTLSNGLGLITFVTDSSVTGTGFAFGWQ